VAGSAYAVTAGGNVEVGTNAQAPNGSTGTADINLVVPPMIQIMVLGDLNTASAVTGDDLVYDGTKDVTGNVSVCVWAKSTGGAYTLSASSGTGFNLTGGTDSIPYAVTAPGAVDLTAGTAARTTTAKNPAGCNATAFNIAIDVLAADIDAQAGDAGTYSDTLSLNVVTP